MVGLHECFILFPCVKVTSDFSEGFTPRGPCTSHYPRLVAHISHLGHGHRVSTWIPRVDLCVSPVRRASLLLILYTCMCVCVQPVFPTIHHSIYSPNLAVNQVNNISKPLRHWLQIVTDTYFVYHAIKETGNNSSWCCIRRYKVVALFRPSLHARQSPSSSVRGI